MSTTPSTPQSTTPNTTPSTTDFQVTGMSCGHCENAIRQEVGEITGVSAIAVSASDGSLSVTHEGPADDASVIAAVIAAVDEAGYTAVTR